MTEFASAGIPSKSLAPVWSAQTWTLGTLFTHIIVTCKPPCRKHKIHLYIFHLQAMTARTGQAKGSDWKKGRESRIGQCGQNLLRRGKNVKCCKALLKFSLNTWRLTSGGWFRVTWKVLGKSGERWYFGRKNKRSMRALAVARIEAIEVIAATALAAM